MAKLKRELGFGTILLLTVNAIIGTGIFFLPATAAGISGPSSLIAWAIMSVIAVFISMYFAELVSMFPHAGGVYEFSKQAFGKMTSFFTGWMAWIVANITMAMLIVGAVQYLTPTAGFIAKIGLSLGIIAIFNYVSYRGVNLSATMLIAFAVATIAVLLALIVPGIFQIDTQNLQPMSFEIFPLFLTIFFVAETFFGWETTTFLSEETKNPRKSLPRALILGTLLVAGLSFLLALVSLGVIHWSTFSLSLAPLLDVGTAVLGTKGALIVKAAIFITIIGAAAGWVVTAPRLIMAMSRDKLFVEFCKEIHPKYRTPHKAILLQSIVTSIVVLIGFGNYEILLSLLLPLVFLMYSIVMYSVVKLRKTKPKIKRYFSAPFPKIGPLVIIGVNILLAGLWIWEEKNALSIFIIGLGFVVLGLPFYTAVRLSYDKKFKEQFFDNFSWFWDKFFPIWYGKYERRKVLENASIKKGNVILDYGCFTGMTTAEIIKKVGPSGTVVAVDVSRKGLEMVEHKMKGSMDNLILIKEEGLLPFRSGTFDGITLVSMLEHFGDPKSELKLLRRVLKPGRKLSALSFGKVYGVPAPSYLENKDSIIKLFKSAGFRQIVVEKRKGFLTEYFFISATN